MKNNPPITLVKSLKFSQLVFQKKPIILLLLLFLTSFSLSAQTIPKGKANLIEFSSNNSAFKVPEGKTWYIYNIFSNRKTIQGGEETEAGIILKSVNGVVFKKGPVVYASSGNLNFPIIFPEKTSFEFEIFSNPGTKAIMTYIETEN